MKKIFHISSAIILILPMVLCAEQLSPEMNTMLTTAESLFQDMQHRDYIKIWSKLSRQSQQTIVHDTYKAIKAQNTLIEEARVATGFAQGDEISQAYWGAFLQNFDPAMILNQCRWELGKITAQRAQIKITYKKTDNPAFLKMYKEGGAWKVGLTESFWSQTYRF